MSRRAKLRLLAVVYLTGAATAFACAWWLFSPPATTPEENRYGLIENWAEEAAPIIAANPPFQLVDAEGNAIVQDNANANVRLWDGVSRPVARIFATTRSRLGTAFLSG